MDSKQKKAPAKKIGKKQFKNYAILDGVSVTDMTKEQLESHVYQLQQEVEKEREERNYYQLERDKIQLFWEVTKQQLEEKDSVLQLKNSEIDDVSLSHLAEVKLYKQKMKHIMFECQQHINEKMKEKMSEKLMLEEEHQAKVKCLEKEIDRLQNEISKLNTDYKMAVANQTLQHEEQVSLLHEEYQKKIDDIKIKEATEIGTIRDEMDLKRKEAIQSIESEKDLHIQHLIETHEELFQKMKNYYNDIIKNDILLIKSLKDEKQCFLRKEGNLKDKLKILQMKNDTLSESLKGLQVIQTKRRRKFDLEDNKLFSSESIIRNLKRELKKITLENDFLLSQLLKSIFLII
ncbi:hypothetical protein JTE90_015068 [Oedothorax gibbosus]|uniref:Dynein regulatory complex subunit 4 n=1 Tax=Oedothorax gibbosus TaxID=931172 RepID=A0AAV6VT44_9ARAC|nr:hypothetical protein JTE90_015068 [Oedothorax gibbosus]